MIEVMSPAFGQSCILLDNKIGYYARLTDTKHFFAQASSVVTFKVKSFDFSVCCHRDLSVEVIFRCWIFICKKPHILIQKD